MAKKLLISFIEGNENDKEFSFAIPSTIIIGRGSSCNIPLNDKKISRKHLRIEVKKNALITLQDMNSTNGTYLNGAKVKESRIKEGDLIRAGRTVFKLDIIDDAGHISQKPTKKEFTVTKATVKTTVDDITSNLENDGLKKVILFLSETRATGVILINTESKKGELYVKDGNVTFVTFDDVFNEKAFFRLMIEKNGEIIFKPKDVEKMGIELEITSQELLKKSESEIVEIQKYEKEIKEAGTKIEINRSTKAPISRLKPKVIDIFQLVMNFCDIDKVLDNSALSDAQTYKILSFLLANKFILKR